MRASSRRTSASSSMTRTVPALPSPAASGAAIRAARSSGERTSRGSRTVKSVPAPGVLSTDTEPPIISANMRLMASPNPVPPYLLAVETSAWEKAWNSLASCSGVMPMPVSCTAKTISSPLPAPGSRLTRNVMVPCSVNLLALDKRLNRIWRTRVTSARMAPRSGASSRVSVLPFFSISGATVVATASTAGPSSKVSRWSSILPASILERSSTSLISASRCRPAARIFWRSGT
jgi:hypothetical protein